MSQAMMRSPLVGDDALAIPFFGRFGFREPTWGPIKAKKAQEKRTRVAASPCLFESSVGRIRNSDLRVMSPTSYQAALPRDRYVANNTHVPPRVNHSTPTNSTGS